MGQQMPGNGVVLSRGRGLGVVQKQALSPDYEIPFCDYG